MKKMYRQGDLLFVAVDESEIPADAKEVRDGIIARGESTGHMHTLRPDDTAMLLMFDNKQFIRNESIGFIDHQEHGTIKLPAGNWSVTRQQEYTPDGWNTVAD